MLVLVLNDEKIVDRVLLLLSDIGIKGATVIDSVGMGSILGVKLPLFSKIENMVQIQKPDNKTIFTLINDEEILRKAVTVLKDKLNLEKPGTGLLFVLPVLEAYGTAEVINND